jgi:sugar phosphate isomerase/epimerase
MQYAISNLAWDTLLHNEFVYKKMKHLGYTGLEIAPGKTFENFPLVSETEADNFKSQIKEYGFTIPSMQSILFGTQGLHLFEDLESRKALLKHMKLCIDLCEKIECSNIVFGSPKNRIIKDWNKDYSIAVDFFQELGEYCRNKKIYISVEANPKIYGGNFLVTTREAFDFVEVVNDCNVKLQLDVGTMIENNEDIYAISNFIPKTSHVHLSRPNLRFYYNERYDREVVDILKKNGYKGYISLETLAENLLEVEDGLNYLSKLMLKEVF